MITKNSDPLLVKRALVKRQLNSSLTQLNNFKFDGILSQISYYNPHNQKFRKYFFLEEIYTNRSCMKRLFKTFNYEPSHQLLSYSHSIVHCQIFTPNWFFPMAFKIVEYLRKEKKLLESQHLICKIKRK